MPVVSFKIIPIVGEKSVSKYIIEAVKVLRDEGLEPIVTPDTTVVSLKSLDDIGMLLSKMHERLRNMGVQRIVSIVMVDDRVDMPLRDPLETAKKVEKGLQG